MASPFNIYSLKRIVFVTSTFELLQSKQLELFCVLQVAYHLNFNIVY